MKTGWFFGRIAGYRLDFTGISPGIRIFIMIWGSMSAMTRQNHQPYVHQSWPLAELPLHWWWLNHTFSCCVINTCSERSFVGLRRSWRAWVRTSSCWKLARWGAGTPAEASPDRDPPRPAAARGRSAATWDLTQRKMRRKMCFQGEKTKEKLQETMGF